MTLTLPAMSGRGLVLLLAPLALLLASCSGSSEPGEPSASPSTSIETGSTSVASFGPTTGDCDTTAATFRDVTSVNADLADPELAATCEGDSVVVNSNSIPDYTYVATTPGSPRVSDVTYTIPTNPTEVDAPNPDDIPRLGAIGVAVDGVPIYGPTEGQGGDVLSLEGALSVCGSHAGPVDFHMHLFGYADDVDCLYSADEATSGDPIVVGWAADGYPIMSGVVCADADCTSTTQLTSSWTLSDDSLFATDTWAAHSYEEGFGDLDQCNGRTDTDGQYRYYTTTTFPYVIGSRRAWSVKTAGRERVAMPTRRRLLTGAGVTAVSVVLSSCSGDSQPVGQPGAADIGFCTDMSFHHEQALAMCQRSWAATRAGPSRLLPPRSSRTSPTSEA